MQRNYSTKQPPKENFGKPLKWIIAIAVLSTGVVALGSKERGVQTDRKPGNMLGKSMSEEDYDEIKKRARAPAFSPDEVKVVFVLGGPGSGKGTQCANIVRDYNFVHLSAGDLLRAEQQREGSQYGELISNYIKSGQIVPQEITISLLKNAMKEAIAKGTPNFLIDGFPRKMDQALTFEDRVVPSKFALFFECPESVMLPRLLDRSKTSGRSDDNIESIKKRFTVFHDQSMPVVNYLSTVDKVASLSCNDTPEKVYAQVRAALASHGFEPK